MSTLTVGTIKSDTTSPPIIQNSSATEVGTFCRAWVNFDGTGTVAIRNDFNVTTLTDNAVGNYTITLTNALSTADYVFACSGRNQPTSANTDAIYGMSSTFTMTTTTFNITVNQSNDSGALDMDTVCITIFC